MQFLRERIQNYRKQHSEKTNRKNIGIFSGVIGIFSNLILFLIKLFAGVISGSISILADAVNNLTDGVSSLLTVGGFYIAGLPPDKEHPYGHQRAEYITGLGVAILIIIVGFEFLMSSIEKIKNPVNVTPTSLVVVLLIISIGVKLFQGLFYRTVGDELQSHTIETVAKDSFNDVLMTVVILFSYFIESVTGWYIDGYVGIIVAIFILYSGYEAIKGSISHIIGERPSPELIRKMKEILDSRQNIFDYHDLVVHRYGPNTTYATVDIEIDSRIPLLEAHNIIDSIEREFENELGVKLVGHLDPVVFDDDEHNYAHDIIKNILKNYEKNFKFHDFRIETIDGEKTLHFDVVVPEDAVLTNQELEEKIKEDIKAEYDHYPIQIHFDRHYFLDDLES